MTLVFKELGVAVVALNCSECCCAVRENKYVISQLLNEEPVISEIIDQAPSLGEDCVALSILHEVELLAALGANIQTMRTGANAHHELPVALRHLTRLVRARASTAPPNDNGIFIYYLKIDLT